MKHLRIILVPALGAALVASATSVRAQSYHLPATPTKGLWGEAAYANLVDLDQSFPSTFWFVGGRLPLAPAIRAVADVPFAHSRTRFDGGPRETSTVLGNPYLGLEYTTRGFTVETGLRLPLNTIDSESTADVVGALGDFQRSESFLDEIVPISGGLTYQHRLARGAILQGRTGVVGIFHTGDDDLGDEALIDYGVLGILPVGAARLGLSFYGRWNATQDEGTFSDNSVHHLGLSADTRVRGVRPGISVRLPIDDTYDEVLDSTIGLYLQVPLR